MRKILMIAALVLAAGFLFAACQGQTAGAVKRDFSIVVGEGKIVTVHGHEAEEVDSEHDDEEMEMDSEAEEVEIVGSFHRWEPAVLVAFKGDTIRLEVTNLRGSNHSFVLKEFLVDTGSLQPRGGTETVEFTVDKAGIFQFVCGLKYEDEETGELTGDCAPDHQQMVGYIIVLNR